MAASRIKGISIEIDGSTTKLQTALKDVNSKIKTTQDALKDVDKLLKLDPKNVELLRQKQQLLSSAIQETGEKLKIERQALEQLKAGPQTEETIRQQDTLAREIIDTENNLKSLTAEYQTFGKEAGEQVKSVSQKMQEAGEKIQSFGEGLSSAGSKLTKGVTLPLVGIGAAATKTAVDFEDAMAKVSTIMDDTAVPFDTMRDAIIDLSNQTGISAADIADNVYNAISAGQKTGDAVQFVEKATKLARAGFTTSADALDILTTAMNAYGMEAGEVDRVSDVLLKTQNLGKTTVGELASAMGKVIPTAKANGVQFEELAGSYAIMTSNGIATAETTTYLNSMLNELGKSGTSAANAFAAGTEHIKSGGLTMQEAMEQGWSLTDVLGVLQQQADASGTTIGNMFGSAEAGKAATVLAGNSEQLKDAIAQMGDAAGTTNEAFGKMDTTGLQAQKTLNELKNTGIEVGTQLLEMGKPALDMLSQSVSNLKNWWDGLSESQQQTVLKIAGVVAIAGPALSILGKATSGIGSLVSVGGGLISKLGSLGGGAKTAAESVGDLAGAAGGAAAPVSNAGGAMGKLSQNALGLVAAGAGILLAATGMALLAQSAIALANAGGPAIAVMGGLIVAVAGMAVGAAALAPALTAGAVGLVAFGGAVTLIGVGILAATSGVTLLATQLPNIATHGGTAAIALAMIGSTLTLIGAGAMVAAGGISAMLLPFAGAAVTIGATDLALVGLIATLGLSTAAGGLLAVALAAISAETKSIATDATTAGAALIAMTTSVNVISAAMDGFKALIKDAADWFVGIFERSKPTATKAAEQMAESAMQGMSRKMTDGTGAMNQKWTSALAEIEKRSSDSFGKIKNGISTDMGDMTKSVRQNLDEIQRSFGGVQFELGKNIKLPHFSLNGKFDPESGKVPTVSVKWYRKAYDDAYILNGATIFGAMNGQYLGGGEGHGSELVVGTDKLMRMIAEASRGGGVTQNLTINAPQRLSAHEVARQTRLANRQLVLSLGGR